MRYYIKYLSDIDNNCDVYLNDVDINPKHGFGLYDNISVPKINLIHARYLLKNKNRYQLLYPNATFTFNIENVQSNL